MLEIYYGHLGHQYKTNEPFYHNIFADRDATRLCNDKKEIHTLVIREATKDETSPYYGWLEPGADKYTMIQSHQKLFEMCFPYGVDSEEKSGKGRKVNLVVTELE